MRGSPFFNYSRLVVFEIFFFFINEKNVSRNVEREALHIAYTRNLITMREHVCEVSKLRWVCLPVQIINGEKRLGLVEVSDTLFVMHS